MSPKQCREKKNRVASTIDTLHPLEQPAKQLPLPWPFFVEVVEDQQAPSDPLLTVFTIGHSNHESDVFLALLRQHRLETLVDIRSTPYSRYAPHFGQDVLHALLDNAGIRYVWAGEALGGRPDDPACYRDGIVRKGNVDYHARAQQQSYQDGVQRLLEHAAGGPVVMMCSEEDPRRCHRHHLIESTLRDRGVMVLHIRRDGLLESIDPVESAPSAPPSPQLTLPGIVV